MAETLRERQELVKFLKHPLVEQALSANDVNKAFQLLSYTNISATYFENILKKLGVPVNNIPAYTYGISEEEFIRISDTIEEYLRDTVIEFSFKDEAQSWINLQIYVDSDPMDADYIDVHEIPMLDGFADNIKALLKSKKPTWGSYDFIMELKPLRYDYAKKKQIVEIDLVFWYTLYGTLRGLN